MGRESHLRSERLPAEVSSRATRESEPELWAGTSALASVSLQGLAVSGFHARQLEWEGRLAGAGLVESGAHSPDNRDGQVIPGALLWTRPGREGIVRVGGARFLEIVVEDDDSRRECNDAGRRFFGDEPWQQLSKLSAPNDVSPTRERTLVSDVPQLRDLGLRVVDLTISSLPNSHGLAVQFCTRPVRLMWSGDAFMIAWYPLEGLWDSQDIRWPHHGVPLRSRDALEFLIDGAPPDDLLASFLFDCLAHMRYQLKTWRLEVDRWEGALFRSVSGGDAVLRGINLESEQMRKLDALASFLSAIQEDLRTFRRRLESELGGTERLPSVELWKETEQIERELLEDQSRRRELIGLIAALASGEQLQAASDQRKATEDQRRATERLNATIMWISALLLAPTVVIGVFGSNISELDPSARGSLMWLLSAVLLAGGVSTAVMVLLAGPQVKTLWVAFAMIAVLLAFAVLAAIRTDQPKWPLAVSLLLWVVVLIFLMRLSRRKAPG